MQNTYIGNKALFLEQLRNKGFRVPAFICVREGLSREEFDDLIRKHFSRTGYFAMRSSAEAEDNPERSLAGHFYSAIGVSPENCYEEYNRVLHSFGSMNGSVIVQQFIQAEISGVLFTKNPDDFMVINSNHGLCKTVVEGKSCDEYIVDQMGRVRQSLIPKQKEALIFENGSLVTRRVGEPSMNPKLLRQLVRAGQKIERFFGMPQDIEWSFYIGKLYILQSRPVTRELPHIKRKVSYDSANIAESYSGMVLPLTLSFAGHIYSKVYRNLLHASGVSRFKLRRNYDVFDHMVDSFYGRLYYNMNNWYKMISFLPGYQRNKVNLEEMITSNVRSETNRSILPSVWLKTMYPVIVIFKLLWFNVSQWNFQWKVNRTIRKFRAEDLNTFSLEKCRKTFLRLDRRLIAKWHVPVENDFMVMTFFGLLKKRLNEDELKNAIRFRSKTTAQINALITLKNALFEKTRIAGAIREEYVQEFLLEIGKYRVLQRKLDNYFIQYGGRFANELKLESEDIEEDPFRLLSLLKTYADKHPVEVSFRTSGSTYPLVTRFLIARFRKYAAHRETTRLLRSNGFSLIRKLMKRVGAIHTEKGLLAGINDVFYLTLNEVFSDATDFKEITELRKKNYEFYNTVTPPAFFTVNDGDMPQPLRENHNLPEILEGRACTPGKIEGRIRVFEEYSFPSDIDFDIIVTRHTDPGWTPLLGLCKGLIIEHGGILSHAAIVSRELGIPTVIGVNRATTLLRTGQRVELNGTSGTVKVLHED